MTTKVLITIGDSRKKAAKGELVFYLPESLSKESSTNDIDLDYSRT